MNTFQNVTETTEDCNVLIIILLVYKYTLQEGRDILSNVILANSIPTQNASFLDYSWQFTALELLHYPQKIIKRREALFFFFFYPVDPSH